MKVGVFIVGAPKAGTTSLHHHLDEHPDIVMSSRKETDYFSSNEILDQGLYYNTNPILSLEDYLNLFPSLEDDKLYGESSVSYLFYSSVADNIYKYNPSSKIIIMLRDPLHRAFSHYLMDRRMGLNSKKFDEIFDEGSGLFFQQYFEIGKYTEQIKRYISVFGREKVHIIWYSDFKKFPHGEIKSLYRFLGVDEDFIPNLGEVHNRFFIPKNILIKNLYTSPLIRRCVKYFFGDKISILKRLLFQSTKKPQLSALLIDKIQDYYFDDICQLEILLDKDLSSWKR